MDGSSFKDFDVSSSGFKNVGSSDESIWRCLREAGFGEDESIKQRDKAVLIAYIAKLESENEIRRLIMAEHEATLETKKSALEAELEQKRRSVENEREAKRRACELREVDLVQREELIQEKEHELEVQRRALVEKEKEATERFNSLQVMTET